MSAESAAGRLDVVNGLRGIAILGVFLVHTLAGHAKPFSTDVATFFGTGWFGVYLFFALSGFVLYLPYASGREFKTVDFLWRRAVRLYPLYAVVAFVSVIFYSGQGAMDPIFPSNYWDAAENLTCPRSSFWTYLLNAITTVSYWCDYAGAPPGNGALWSLAIEIYLSAAFPLIVFTIARFGARNVTIAVCVFSGLMEAGYPLLGSEFYFGKAAVVARGAACFCVGIWIADLWHRGVIPSQSRFAPIVFCIASIALYLLLASVSSTRSSSLSDPWYSLFWPASYVLLGAAIAAALALPTGILRFVLTLWPLQLAGMMCYSIYVWHMPLLGKIGAGAFIDDLNDAYRFAVVSFTCIAMFSFLTYRFIEFPKQPLLSILPPFPFKRRDPVLVIQHDKR